MNLKNRLLHLASLNNPFKSYGLTTTLAKAAKELGAVLIVATTDEARHVQRLHKGLIVKSMDVNLSQIMGPFILDHHAVDRIFKRAAIKIETLESLVEQKDEEIEKLRSQISMLETNRPAKLTDLFR